jgi:hypothetical protein
MRLVLLGLSDLIYIFFRKVECKWKTRPWFRIYNFYNFYKILVFYILADVIFWRVQFWHFHERHQINQNKTTAKISQFTVFIGCFVIFLSQFTTPLTPLWFNQTWPHSISQASIWVKHIIKAHLNELFMSQ